MFTEFAPDLAVEVVSPYDLAYDVDIKIEQWLRAGVAVVWVVMPPTRKVTVYRGSSLQPQVLTAEEEITLPDLIPEFRCRVGEFFPPTYANPSA
jgi:Uma2 family endonuclease